MLALILQLQHSCRLLQIVSVAQDHLTAPASKACEARRPAELVAPWHVVVSHKASKLTPTERSDLQCLRLLTGSLTGSSKLKKKCTALSLTLMPTLTHADALSNARSLRCAFQFEPVYALSRLNVFDISPEGIVSSNRKTGSRSCPGTFISARTPLSVSPRR